jgi:hypothetical protein
MIAALDPWQPDIDLSQRLARPRSIRAIARLWLGPRSARFAASLRAAETDAGQLEPALRELDALAALDRRAVLASFAALPRGGR